ncbi:MAG: uridine kinase [Oscillospiraceae bacterium]
MPRQLSELLKAHLRAHPQARITDAVKYIYQNEFGGGHLITDAPAALARLKEELYSCAASDAPLTEPLGNGLVRLNLYPARERISPETLSAMFKLSSEHVQGDMERFYEKLELLHGLGYPREELDGYISEYKKAGCPAVSHSPEYRAAYAPAYRVVLSAFGQFFEVFSAADKLLSERENVTVAIDGMCASGKTTLARLLGEVYDANVFHADDYFLPPEKRTVERLSEPGGNMDRERLLMEAVMPISRGEECVTRRFDCSTFELLPPVRHPKKRLNIIEGSYCLHPELRSGYTLKVMLRTDYNTQLERLKRRDPDRLGQFIERWIPLENSYFDNLKIAEAADIIIDT